MVDDQIVSRGVKDPLVLKAMRKVPRHLLVPQNVRHLSYEDYPLPIGEGQTISQPYIVALMTELLHLKGGEKVLEVGTGSGYQAAILAEIGSKVISIEIVKPLADRARRDLAQMGYKNITVICGDGYHGKPDEAPFDAIIVTAAAPRIPEPLVEQLKVGARLVIPVGEAYQELLVLTKTPKGVERESIIPVRFVPMTGEVQKRKE
jgi:protein-L-isoaspartate(D-aspartate) O-methyltransferase